MPLAHILSSGFSCKGKPQPQQLTVTAPATQQLHYSQRMIVVVLGGCVEPTPRAQISCFFSPASTVTATVQDGIGLCTKGETDTGLGRRSPSLGGGKQATCPCPSGFGICTPLCSHESCGLAASDGVKGSSRERISVRQRNHFQTHSQCNNSKEGRKREQEHSEKHCSGFALIDLLGSGP